ncbi:hypothetical protein PVAND_001973 [Polypedilum vanderplanki]|uniref:Anaphase-promoting complex subunit 4 n=1 Tax=Polypedilum vanderplanki TaxID=319348 RepID=A0A9J6BQ33_POLVA|nr:hypothetical protein PVAND_001973 [Polypedilum vanderplanki]
MSMKLIGNRNNPNCIQEMQWSNKMDLIALVNDTGEVTINRFKWDMPIKILPPEEKIAVKSISWRMDERIIGIAYNNQLINLVDIESKEVIISYSVNADVTKICWTQNSIDIDSNEKSILDDHVFLASLPSINSTISSGTKKSDYNSTRFYSNTGLNFLIVICNDCTIRAYIYGVLSCGSIDVKKKLNVNESDSLNIIEAKMSSNFERFFVVYVKNGILGTLVFENSALLKRHVALWKLSIKYGMILNIFEYMDDTIEHINEAWESVLLEMDNKLSKYAKKQEAGSISADFLELLLFGYPSEELENFLTHEMTVRELKKLSNSVEMSYSTIQKLVVKPLHSAIISIFYHVNNLHGMHQNAYEYKNLLGENSSEALISTGSFLIKSHELQQIIDKSMRDFKIFFRWLYIAISRLMDDTVPDDAGVITQQEVNYLAEFLYNFEENRKELVHDESGEKEIKFNLERVGQYLTNQNLTIPSIDNTSNIWNEIFTQNECLQTSKLIYPHNKDSSLIQEKNKMEKSIKDLFNRLEHSIGQEYNLKNDFIISHSDDIASSTIVTSHIIDGENQDAINLFTILLSEKDLLLLVYYSNTYIPKIAKLQFTNRDECNILSVGQLSFIDIKFYNTRLLSGLIKNEIGNKIQTCFIQVPVSRLIDELLEYDQKTIPTFNMYNYIDDCNFKVIEGFAGNLMAVSGSRKVAAFLASNQKIVKLYELEVDEDDECDEENSNNASFEIEMKM